MRSTFGDLQVHPGDHIIAVLTDEFDLEIAAAYAAEGLKGNEACAIMALAEQHKEIGELIRSSYPSVSLGEDVTLMDPLSLGTQKGAFDIDAFIQGFRQLSEQISKRQVAHLRNCGLMGWLSGAASTEEIIYFESRLNLEIEGGPISGF